LGFFIAAVLFLRGRPGGQEAGGGPDVLVRARVDAGAPVPDPLSGAERAERETAGMDDGTAGMEAAGSAGMPVLSIQVASFRTTRRAEAVLAEVSRRTGIPGIVLPTEVDGVRWQRILLGSFASEAEAREAARPLLQDGTIREILIRPVPERWIPVLTGGASP
jgi:hypothetical protein